MKKIIRITELENLLKRWELENIASKLFFADYLTGLKSERPPLTGSEIDSKKFLGRPIKNYKDLRDKLSKNQEFNFYNFLPRIPKNYRDSVNESMWFLHFNYILKAPAFLSVWNSSKKVCFIKNNDLIPRIGPQNNYLKYLPYSSFLLKLDQEVILKMDKAPDLEICFKSLIISSSEQLVSVMVLPLKYEDNDMYPDYSSLDKLMNTALNNADRFVKGTYGNINKLRKERDTLGDQIVALADKCNIFNDAMPYTFHYHVESGNLLSDHPEIDRLWEIDYSEAKPGVDYGYNLLLIINGIGKLFFDLPAGESSDNPEIFLAKELKNKNKNRDVINVSSTEKEVLPQWNEIYFGEIKKVEIEKVADQIKIVRITGGEKSPHLRRAHKRSLKNPDGSRRIIWIKSTTIRKDKLGEQSIKGSSLGIE
jgi:hypothetical protein